MAMTVLALLCAHICVTNSPLNPPASKYDPSSLYYFDQTVFDIGSKVGLNETGYVYIPHECMSQSCKLHISLHGCSVNNYYEEAVHHLSFNYWAETNNIVIVYPRMAQHGTTVQEKLVVGMLMVRLDKLMIRRMAFK